MTNHVSLTNVKIESERLIQIPITMEYAQDIFYEFSEDITKYMYPPTPAAKGETHAFIAQSIGFLNQGTNLQLVVLDKSTGEFLGCSGIHDIDHAAPELGIWIKKSAHGHGFGMEAVSALIAWSEANLECEYLIYPVDRRNAASRRIPELHGGIVMKEFKQRKPNGFELDLVEYWIFRSRS